MAKAKAASVPNKSLHSRVSYLYQAATYLATQENPEVAMRGNIDGGSETSRNSNDYSAFGPASRRLISDLRSVSLKVQMRIAPAMKHKICKTCDSLLLDGSTCTTEIENKSRGGKKPWADVLVRKCNTCGVERRFPLAARTQDRKFNRVSKRASDQHRMKPG